jgi:nucleotide-binding universal stress UspA family protein
VQSSRAASDATPASGADVGFDYVLVGIDDTPESLVAAAQARVLLAPGGKLVLVAVTERYLASHAGLAASHAGDTLAAATAADLERAQELVDADETVSASGRLVEVLCAERERRGASLIAVGVRPHRRVVVVTFGGHDIEALHDARSAILIARPGWGPMKPDRIVVGADSPPEARAAELAARRLAERLECDVVPVVALDDHVDLPLIRSERDDALFIPGELGDAVVGAATKSSLVVVGRAADRGPHRGPDFAERLVYAASCSVLVIRHESGPAAA